MKDDEYHRGGKGKRDKKRRGRRENINVHLETNDGQAGVFAVRAGPPLLRNLQNALRGATLTTYTPQVGQGGNYW